MKIDMLHLNLFTFCYIFFSFTLYSPINPMNVYDWIYIMAIYTAAYFLLTLILTDGRTYKPLVYMYILFYIIFLFSKQINKIFKYIQMFHGKESGFSILIISAIIILMFIKSEINLYKLAVPCIFMVVTIISIVTLLNADKINSMNLYQNIERNNNYIYKTMFDYIIPYIVISNLAQNKNKYNKIFFIIISNLIILTIILVAFSCVNGNFVYSLSPLQMLFQISQTPLVKNYDALFNFLVLFAYFAAIAFLMITYKAIKKQFGYFNDSILLLIIPPFIRMDYINEFIFIIAEGFGVLAVLLGREKSKKI